MSGLTGEGRVALLLVAAVWLVASLGGNNLVYAVAAVGIACWMAEALLGWWNLRDLSLRRELPDELYAGAEAHGWIAVRNARGMGASAALEIADGGAVARLPLVPVGVERRAPVAWRFERRGPAALDVLEIRSTFPFGWRERRIALRCPAELVVYPQPLRGAAPAVRTDRAGDGAVRGYHGGTGDLADLRPWREGDPVRTVHAATSARFGAWMVAERETETAPAVWVALDPGLPLEAAIGLATGEILRAAARGAAVGLVLGAERLPPRTGTAWRRQLLERLARVEA